MLQVVEEDSQWIWWHRNLSHMLSDYMSLNYLLVDLKRYDFFTYGTMFKRSDIFDVIQLADS